MVRGEKLERALEGCPHFVGEDDTRVHHRLVQQLQQAATNIQQQRQHHGSSCKYIDQ